MNGFQKSELKQTPKPILTVANRSQKRRPPSFLKRHLPNIKIEDALWPQISRVKQYLQKLESNRADFQDETDNTQNLKETLSQSSEDEPDLPEVEGLFSDSTREMIRKTIGRGMFSSLETSTLSHQNFQNLLLQFWISLSSALPVQKIMGKGHFLCEICVERRIGVIKSQVMFGVREITSCPSENRHDHSVSERREDFTEENTDIVEENDDISEESEDLYEEMDKSYKKKKKKTRRGSEDEWCPGEEEKEQEDLDEECDEDEFEDVHEEEEESEHNEDREEESEEEEVFATQKQVGTCLFVDLYIEIW